MRALLVEDDTSMAMALGKLLKSINAHYFTTGTATEALEQARSGNFDVVILDLGLPDLHGEALIRQMRQYKVNTPILVLSGDSRTDVKVQCLNSGADDYITKPFENDEFVARVQSLVRRHKGHSQSLVNTGPICIDLSARTVTVNASRVGLTNKEYAIFEMLALRKGMTLTKDMFLVHLYDEDDKPEEKIIDVFVCKIRKKLHEAGAPVNGCIETLWGRGYTLRDPDSN